MIHLITNESFNICRFIWKQCYDIFTLNRILHSTIIMLPNERASVSIVVYPRCFWQDFTWRIFRLVYYFEHWINQIFVFRRPSIASKNVPSLRAFADAIFVNLTTSYILRRVFIIPKVLLVFRLIWYSMDVCFNNKLSLKYSIGFCSSSLYTKRIFFDLPL